MADISGRKDMNGAVVICRFKPFDFRAATENSLKCVFASEKENTARKQRYRGMIPMAENHGKQILL